MLSRLAVGGVLAALAAATLPPPAAVPLSLATPQPVKADESPAEKLNRRFDFAGIDDKKTTLQDVLNQLAKQFDVRFEINDKAFRYEMIPDVSENLVAVKALPPAKNVRLGTVLQRVLDRIEVGSGATFTVRRDFIELTTRQFQAAQVWGFYNGPHLPLVHLKVDKRPLDEVLQDLAGQAEFNVLLDQRAGDLVHTPVTCRFVNTPLDTAVRFLADAAHLRSLQLDNVLYVTTPENASRWEARLRKEKGSFKERKAYGQIRQAGWRAGIGPTPPLFDLDDH